MGENARKYDTLVIIIIPRMSVDLMDNQKYIFVGQF